MDNKKIAVTWFSCGRDEMALSLSVDSVREKVGELGLDAVLLVVEDQKDPLSQEFKQSFKGRVLPGVDHGKNLDSLEGIVNQLYTWTILIQEEHPKWILKIDSDVLWLGQGTINDALCRPVAGKYGGQVAGWNYLQGGAYWMNAAHFRIRFFSDAWDDWRTGLRDEVLGWDQVSSGQYSSRWQEDQVITGMLGSNAWPGMHVDGHFGYHNYRGMSDVADFIEFGRLRGLGDNRLQIRDEVMRKALYKI